MEMISPNIEKQLKEINSVFNEESVSILLESAEHGAKRIVSWMKKEKNIQHSKKNNSWPFFDFLKGEPKSTKKEIFPSEKKMLIQNTNKSFFNEM